VSVILDAIDQELAVARERVTQLEGLRESAAALDGFHPNRVETPTKPEGGGVGDPPPKPRQKRRRRATKPRQSKPRSKATPKAARDTKPSSHQEPLEGVQDQILDALLARPGEWLRAGQIQAATGLTGSRFREAMKALRKLGRIRMEGQRAGAKYLHADDEASAPDTSAPRFKRPVEPPITEADQNGARTGLERQVVEAVQAVELTESEIAANTEVPESRVREVLAGLCRRGVLTREGKLYGVAA
jgi:hypothetical protein